MTRLVERHLALLSGFVSFSVLLLIWQLTPEFTFDPDLVTEVEVTFAPEGEGTRVDLEHRHIERMGDKADAMRESVSGPGGWPALLQLYADEANSEKGDAA